MISSIDGMIWIIVIWYMVQRVEVVLGEQRTEEARLGSALGVEDKGNDQAVKTQDFTENEDQDHANKDS